MAKRKRIKIWGMPGSRNTRLPFFANQEVSSELASSRKKHKQAGPDPRRTVIIKMAKPKDTEERCHPERSPVTD